MDQPAHREENPVEAMPTARSTATGTMGTTLTRTRTRIMLDMMDTLEGPGRNYNISQVPRISPCYRLMGMDIHVGRIRIRACVECIGCGCWSGSSNRLKVSWGVQVQCTCAPGCPT